MTSSIVSCRVCHSKELKLVLDLGYFFISDFVKEGDEVYKIPLELVRCNQCSLVQLRHTVKQGKLYTQKYWYKSSINPVIVKDLEEIANIAIKEVNGKKKDIFLDIGANDGTLLKYVPKTFCRIGVEPAPNFYDELKSNCDIAIKKLWSIGAYARIWGKEGYDEMPKAQIVTAIGMFYDSENPNEFVNDIKHVLDENGIVIAQMMTLKQMVINNDVSNICHEHLEYYSYKSLKELFERNGLEIYRVEENNINGGSYRIFARHYKNGSIIHRELPLDLENFIQNIELEKSHTLSFISQEKEKGKKIYGYGASTKGNTILQYYDLNEDDIIGIADRNPEKIGRRMVGSNIPIVSEKEAREKADYFFVLPYAFFDYFVAREQDFIKRGGKLFTSIPHFRICPQE